MALRCQTFLDNEFSSWYYYWCWHLIGLFHQLVDYTTCAIINYFCSFSRAWFCWWHCNSTSLWSSTLTGCPAEHQKGDQSSDRTYIMGCIPLLFVVVRSERWYGRIFRTFFEFFCRQKSFDITLVFGWNSIIPLYILFNCSIPRYCEVEAITNGFRSDLQFVINRKWRVVAKNTVKNIRNQKIRQRSLKKKSVSHDEILSNLTVGHGLYG